MIVSRDAVFEEEKSTADPEGLAGEDPHNPAMMRLLDDGDLQEGEPADPRKRRRGGSGGVCEWTRRRGTGCPHALGSKSKYGRSRGQQKRWRRGSFGWGSAVRQDADLTEEDLVGVGPRGTRSMVDIMSRASRRGDQPEGGRALRASYTGDIPIPRSYGDAMASAEREQWMEACRAEARSPSSRTGHGAWCPSLRGGRRSAPSGCSI